MVAAEICTSSFLTLRRLGRYGRVVKNARCDNGENLVGSEGLTKGRKKRHVDHHLKSLESLARRARS